MRLRAISSSSNKYNPQQNNMDDSTVTLQLTGSECGSEGLSLGNQELHREYHT